ncbi:MAG: D-alanine-D-alanine ligase [Patiriisocius sp.]|jgi:D-alanine-D-alanine ligase
MKNIAVLTGGYSGEIEVSLKSASTVMKYLDMGQYNPILVHILRDRWYANLKGNECPIDKNDFSFVSDNEKVEFDFAYIVIHGTPGEDGKIQGYLEMLEIPYSTGNVLNTALTFNKISTKQALDEIGYYTADYVHFRQGELYDSNDILKKLGLPLFVKPAESGSSLGISKVKEMVELPKAIEETFKFHDQCLIEGFVEGREITCGAFIMDGTVKVLPITEVITQKEFFDYKAKYEHDQTVEVTPADLSEKDYKACQEMTGKIYGDLGCEGIVRVDYILSKKGLMIIEINTVPGLTDMSFIPQQVRAAGIDLTKFFESSIKL